MAGWHLRPYGHELSKPWELVMDKDMLDDSLVCCSPWGHKESDMTEQLN